MTRPTKEQIDEARAWFSKAQLDHLTGIGYGPSADHIRALLAATEKPSEEELAEEAARYALAKDGAVEAGTSTLIHVEEAYLAGARRKGRR